MGKSDHDQAFPSRWPHSGGSLHRHRTAYVSQILPDNVYAGTITIPSGDLGEPPGSVSSVDLRRGHEMRGGVVPGFYYPVARRDGRYYLTGGGWWAARGFKFGSQVYVAGVAFDVELPPWVTDWGSLANNVVVGLNWNEETLKWYPVVAKCT
jgi:hypothetical protein